MPVSILQSCSDLLFPRSCELCGCAPDRPGRHLCSDCLGRLDFIPTDGLCRRCGRDAPGLDGEFLCEDCRTYRPAFDRAVSALRFDGDVRELVNAFKFRRAFHLRDDLVDFLEAAVRARFRIGEISAVIPIPSRFLHRFLRGYNPCEILARPLARRLGVEYVASALKRCGSPRRQGGLKEAERRENVKGTFKVVRSASVADRTVLVVDDIMTTGSTLSEAALTLKTAGARAVWTVSVARSLRL